MIVKKATEDWEFEQIFKLNYSTFVEEIPQHPANEEKKLKDKFHEVNEYIIAVNHNEVLGMICINDKRPFSLDKKLENIEKYLPEAKKIVEIRLLSVKKEARGSLIFFNLFNHIRSVCFEKGYDLAIISGTVLQERLYKKIGFIPFAHKVGTDKALYQPMYLTWEALDEYLTKIEDQIELS